jgi:RNA polymerase sigma-70 factor (family 1)
MAIKKIDQLVDAWLSGNDEVYQHIFDHYYPKLFPVCLKSVKQREDSEEMVMNVFLNIWQHRKKLLQVESFERYIFTVLRNQMSDFSRKNILATEDINTLPLEQLGSVNHPELSFKELERIYNEAINRLPEKRREVFLMSREQGLSHQAIAEQSNISVNTVNNHIKSAMKIIRNDMGEYSEALPLIIIMASAILKK